MKQIPLTQGYFALVDDEDFDELSKYKWCVTKEENRCYAKRSVRISGKRKSLKMHSFIMKTPKGMCTDHIDGNGLNNQRNNLRICTTQENGRNRGRPINNTSGYKGVRYEKRNRYKKWKASIIVNKKTIHLGSFINKEDAYVKYCEAARAYFGNFIHSEQSEETLLQIISLIKS